MNMPCRLPDGKRNNAPERWSFEHRRRLADGGDNSIENLGLAHRICNMKAGVYLGCLDAWVNLPDRDGRRWRGRLLPAWPALPLDWKHG